MVVLLPPAPVLPPLAPPPCRAEPGLRTEGGAGPLLLPPLLASARPLLRLLLELPALLAAPAFRCTHRHMRGSQGSPLCSVVDMTLQDSLLRA